MQMVRAHFTRSEYCTVSLLLCHLRHQIRKGQLSFVTQWTNQWGVDSSSTTDIVGTAVGELALLFEMSRVSTLYPIHLRDQELLFYNTSDFFKPHVDRARAPSATDGEQCVTHLGTLLLVVPGVDCEGAFP
jgi:hypothetical protein